MQTFNDDAPLEVENVPVLHPVHVMDDVAAVLLEYVPATHCEQLNAMDEDHDPALQATHVSELVAEILVEKLPAIQPVHDEEFADDQVPPVHPVQFAAPNEDQEPAGHSGHEVTAMLDEYDPLAQARQAALDAAETVVEYVPGTQAVQVAAPDDDHVPVLHERQVFAVEAPMALE